MASGVEPPARSRYSREVRSLGSIALGAAMLGASACAPEVEAAFDDSAYRTLIIGVRVGDGWQPQVIDLDEQRDRVVYPWSESVPAPLAYWRAGVGDLALVDDPPAIAEPSECPARRVRLSDADALVCQDADGVRDCGPDGPWRTQDWAVRREPWPADHDPCAPYLPFERLRVVSFDVQTTTVPRSGGDVTAGAGTLAVPVGPGLVVLGQLSGWFDPAVVYPLDTELGLYPTDAVLSSEQAPIPRTRIKTSTAWISGAPRAEGVAWLGSQHTALGSYHGPDGRLEIVVPALSSGHVLDMDSDPADRERVLVATSSCSLHLREPGATAWTTLIPPIEGLLLPPRGVVCEPRVHFAGPGYALVVGLPGTLPGEAAPERLRFQARIGRLVEVRGDRVTAHEVPWPALDGGMGRSLRAVSSYQEADGARQVVLAGAQYAQLPQPDSQPFNPGRGRSLLFLRRADAAPESPWRALLAQPLSESMGERGPVLFGDLTAHEPITLASGAVLRGLLVGANNAVQVFEPIRAERGAQPAISRIEYPWQAIGTFPLVTRVRADGDGGFVIVTGDVLRFPRVDVQRRFSWWRPR